MTSVRRTHKETSIPIVSLCLIEKKEAAHTHYQLLITGKHSAEERPCQSIPIQGSTCGTRQWQFGDSIWTSSHMRDVCLCPPKGVKKKTVDLIIGLLYYCCPALPRGEGMQIRQQKVSTKPCFQGELTYSGNNQVGRNATSNENQHGIINETKERGGRGEVQLSDDSADNTRRI